MDISCLRWCHTLPKTYVCCLCLLHKLLRNFVKQKTPVGTITSVVRLVYLCEHLQQGSKLRAPGRRTRAIPHPFNSEQHCTEICETAGLSKWPCYLILDSQSRPRLFTQPALHQWPSIRSRKVSEACLPRESIGWAAGKWRKRLWHVIHASKAFL